MSNFLLNMATLTHSVPLGSLQGLELFYSPLLLFSLLPLWLPPHVKTITRSTSRSSCQLGAPLPGVVAAAHHLDSGSQLQEPGVCGRPSRFKRRERCFWMKSARPTSLMRRGGKSGWASRGGLWSNMDKLGILGLARHEPKI